jgi:polyvinyl alcohol dehydrogenase (cytochrome)
MRRAFVCRARILRGGLGVLLMGISGKAAAQAPAEWTVSGQNVSNTRFQAAETTLGPENVSGLKPKWVFTTGGDVTATPAISADAVYVPDWAGNLFKIDALGGAAVWSRSLADYTGIAKTIARTSPAVRDGVVYVGTLDGAYLLAINTGTGDLLWKTQLDPHPAAVVTQSPVVFQQRVYVGVSSKEELVASLVPGYKCCTFRGSIVAVDAASGSVAWRTYTTPANGGVAGGYSGVAVWGSTPVVDAARNALYFTTGNNYSVPPDVEACEKARQGDPSQPSCLAPDDHVDAIVALDLQTGAIKWSTRMQGYDAWNFTCLGLPGRPRPSCPDPRGPDYDFGQGPMLFTAAGGDGPRELLGAGQKSGIFWALDPATGAAVWSRFVGPAGALGGLQWGSATDGARIYTAVTNSGRKRYTLPSGESTRSGLWSALDAATGAILWQTAVPAPRTGAMGPVTVANGVVYAGSMARSGDNMFALDAAAGTILWRYPSGGSVAAGPSVANGTVYWGSGYSNLRLGSANNKLYAFALPH